MTTASNPHAPAPLSSSELEQPIGNPAEAGWQAVSEKHRDRASRLLDASQRLSTKKRLTSGERLRISNDAWGAVAHTVRAIAALHGWSIVPTDSIRRFVRELDSGDYTLIDTYWALFLHHVSYYGDTLHEPYVRDAPWAAARLINRLWDAAPRLEGRTTKPDGARDMQQEKRFKENHTRENRESVRERNQQASARATQRVLAARSSEAG